MVYEEKNIGTEYQICPVLCFYNELRVGEGRAHAALVRFCKSSDEMPEVSYAAGSIIGEQVKELPGMI